MNQIKLVVLLGGLVGLVGCFLPIASAGDASFTVWDTIKADAFNALVLVGFVVPFALAAMAFAKPPFMRWQALGALVGFALAAIKLRNGLPTDIFQGEIGSKMMGGGLYVGLLGSLVGVIKPETAR